MISCVEPFFATGAYPMPYATEPVCRDGRRPEGSAPSCRRAALQCTAWHAARRRGPSPRQPVIGAAVGSEADAEWGKPLSAGGDPLGQESPELLGISVSGMCLYYIRIV
jgi:hypothetical protein